jgi:predicted dehydrogenase
MEFPMTENNEAILLVGAGKMAVEYAKALALLDIRPIVLGRGAASAAEFSKHTGITPSTGPLADQLTKLAQIPSTAIVAVNAQYLAAVTTQLLHLGVKRLLVEKPAALDIDEMAGLVKAVEAAGAEVFLGYNRRFMSSVLRAKEMVKEDGGILSVKFDFSEPARRIAQLDKPQRELDTWFYGNSSHVVDLAFHFFGEPVNLSGDVSGGVSWHPAAGIFSGHGRNADGALLTWHANWMAPGRWGVEVMTPERRLILQPLEKLRVQSQTGFDEVAIDLDDADDKACKPGLLNQIRAFLSGEPAGILPELRDHARYMQYYEIVRTGGRSAQ